MKKISIIKREERNDDCEYWKTKTSEDQYKRDKVKLLALTKLW